jgi:hypothetical protein
MQTCKSLGLNPMTKPFSYIVLNAKLTLYANKDCADQLRRLHGIGIGRPEIQFQDELIIVTVSAKDKDGREDSDVGIVKKGDMRGDLANAIMKAVTKAKRRVTLSICGLGWLDETEVETIKDASPVIVAETGEIVDAAPAGPSPQPEPPNGHGRPYTPKQLCDHITDHIMHLQGKPADEKQRGLAMGMLNECFAGDNDSDKKRHSVLKFLVGADSGTKLAAPEILALLKWLAPKKDSGGAYHVDPLAAQEAQAVITAVLLEAGQETLAI